MQNGRNAAEETATLDSLHAVQFWASPVFIGKAWPATGNGGFSWPLQNPDPKIVEKIGVLIEKRVDISLSVG
jgi:hypothetical protein